MPCPAHSPVASSAVPDEVQDEPCLHGEVCRDASWPGRSTGMELDFSFNEADKDRADTPTHGAEQSASCRERFLPPRSRSHSCPIDESGEPEPGPGTPLSTPLSGLGPLVTLAIIPSTATTMHAMLNPRRPRPRKCVRWPGGIGTKTSEVQSILVAVRSDLCAQMSAAFRVLRVTSQ